MEITGPVKLVLYASSTAKDTDFFIKLSDQFPQSPDDRAKGLNPFAELITRGWLRASHRALDPTRSTDMVPYQSHSDPQPLTPNEIYKFEISLEPMAYLIKQGHRLRIEIVNGDSPATEILWSHYYRPDKIGSDTIHHDTAHPSELLLPADLEREFRLTGGHWHHGELALDQFMMLRPVPGAAQYAMPVGGLYLCGAGCHPGGGVMGSAGRNAANAVLAAERAAVAGGRGPSSIWLDAHSADLPA